MTDAAETSNSSVDPIRAARLREEAQRPMSTNLAEGIALSHKLLEFAGAALRQK